MYLSRKYQLEIFTLVTSCRYNKTQIEMILIFYFSLLLSVNNYFQNEKIVQVSYNLNNEKIHENNRKITDDGEITFYINGNYFQHIKNSEIKEVSLLEIEPLEFKSISDLIIYRQNKIKKEIEDSNKTGVLRILENSEVFEQIYIFEKKKNNTILKYPVEWLEVIECR